MNILVLGGTGYLGFNIVDALSMNDHNVTCVVRSTSHIDNLKKLRNVNLIINSSDQIQLAFKQKRYDWVINAVCIYTPNETLYGDMLEANVIFPLSVLNLAIKNGVKNYMTMGTSLPADLNVYSFTKTKFSDFGQYFSSKDGINFVDLKLEMFYGGLYEPDYRFIRSSALKILKGEPVLLTEGKQKRDLISVDDVVSIILRIVGNNSFANGYMSLPVGTGEQYSIREIVEYMKTYVGSSSELKFGAIPTRVGEPNTCADTSWYKGIGYKLDCGIFDKLKEYLEITRTNSLEE